jgi:hypothetical protein
LLEKVKYTISAQLSGAGLRLPVRATTELRREERVAMINSMESLSIWRDNDGINTYFSDCAIGLPRSE